jgi:hypothetical protein
VRDGVEGKEIDVAFAVLWHIYSDIWIRESIEHGVPRVFWASAAVLK